jgi:hypothetical protein
MIMPDGSTANLGTKKASGLSDINPTAATADWIVPLPPNGEVGTAVVSVNCNGHTTATTIQIAA